MIPFSLIIPGRPIAWERGTPVMNKRTGRIIVLTPKKMRADQDMIRELAAIVMKGRVLMDGPLKFEMLCVYAIPPSWHPTKQAAARAGLVWKTSVPDWDNLAKTEDALKGTVFHDDATIARASVGKRFGDPERTEIQISRMMGVFGSCGSDSEFRAWAAREQGQDDLPLACNTES